MFFTTTIKIISTEPTELRDPFKVCEAADEGLAFCIENSCQPSTEEELLETGGFFEEESDDL